MRAQTMILELLSLLFLKITFLYLYKIRLNISLGILCFRFLVDPLMRSGILRSPNAQSDNFVFDAVDLQLSSGFRKMWTLWVITGSSDELKPEIGVVFCGTHERRRSHYFVLIYVDLFSRDVIVVRDDS